MKYMKKGNYRNIVVVHGSDYDSGKSLGSFMNSVKMSGKPDPLQFNIEEYDQKSDILIDKISAIRCRLYCIILPAFSFNGIDQSDTVRKK